MHRGCSWARRKVPIVGGHPVVFTEEPLLAKLRSSETDIVSLLFHQRYKWASQPHSPYSPRKGLACVLPVCPATTYSLSLLSLGCLCCSQSYFCCCIICETLWESQNPLPLGCLWLLLLFLSVREMNGLLEKTTTIWVLGARYCVCVCQTDSCLYQDWLIPWLEKGSQRHVKILLSCLFGCLICCNSSVSLCCSLWGKQEGLRWGGLSSLFPSVAYRFLLCIKLPLKSVKDLHLEKRY